MRNAYRYASIFAAIGALILPGCGGANASLGTPSQATTGSVQTLVAPDVTNMAGQYLGTIDDNKNGKGVATASLAQYKNSLGGGFAYKYTNATYITTSTGLISGNTVKGTSIVSISKTTCVYSFTSTYNPTKFTFNGTYKAVSGCTGESGKLSLTEQCSYPNAVDAVRRDGGLGRC